MRKYDNLEMKTEQVKGFVTANGASKIEKVGQNAKPLTVNNNRAIDQTVIAVCYEKKSKQTVVYVCDKGETDIGDVGRKFNSSGVGGVSAIHWYQTADVKPLEEALNKQANPADGKGDDAAPSDAEAKAAAAADDIKAPKFVSVLLVQIRAKKSAILGVPLKSAGLLTEVASVKTTARNDLQAFIDQLQNLKSDLSKDEKALGEIDRLMAKPRNYAAGIQTIVTEALGLITAFLQDKYPKRYPKNADAKQNGGATQSHSTAAALTANNGIGLNKPSVKPSVDERTPFFPSSTPVNDGSCCCLLM